ncbi:GNAT family N-acetyltransferase [Colwellia sp. E2M01]|uniref:GNAT family N-acetyltransferase n=1 Tax=Colwellia sp. E2M01 TaxID=2841561 RepID=UPI001C083A5D|nr:GNAT family N-acetyltransferase [Colwellia sp. E2M01]MBU2869084.1 GNAT family N-acetyltransferase [Colwellia sp. E2M01]
MSIKKHTITIKPFDKSQKENLGDKWQLLESNSDCSVFLSWLWIGNWLDAVKGNLFIVEAICDDKTVGLGLFVEKSRKVFGCFPIKQWLLHKTGIQQQDQMWIEYNDFLLDASCESLVREKMIKAVGNFDPSIKEVIIGLSASEELDLFTQAFAKLQFLATNIVKTNGYFASLSATKDAFFTQVLSKNTRNQISRSKKRLQAQGTLRFEVFSEPQKLMTLYPKIARIHIDRWQDTKEGSGFSNPIFEQFHHSIVAHNANNMVQIAVLSLNDVELGYLVNFVYRNKVYFYLSALQDSPDNKIKVGMTLHNEAIQYYAEQGLESYDFLGGEARYKKSLSNNQYQLEMICFYRDSYLLKIECLLKSCKAKLLAIFTDSEQY